MQKRLEGGWSFETVVEDSIFFSDSYVLLFTNIARGLEVSINVGTVFSLIIVVW